MPFVISLLYALILSLEFFDLGATRKLISQEPNGVIQEAQTPIRHARNPAFVRQKRLKRSLTGLSNHRPKVPKKRQKSPKSAKKAQSFLFQRNKSEIFLPMLQFRLCSAKRGSSSNQCCATGGSHRPATYLLRYGNQLFISLSYDSLYYV
jgi:hypothetical protein